MEKVAVVTDSSVCLPEEVVAEYSIYIVPMELIVEGKVYRDGIDITPSQFYPLLATVRKLPTTSAPTSGAYLEAYRRANEKASGIFCITVSSDISGMFEAARQAREEARRVLPGATIHVLDSRTGAGAQGFIALEAARAAADGKNLAEVIEVAQSMIPRVNILILLDTLHYLVKGGRVPAVQGYIGSLLKFKPILHIPTAVGKVEGLDRPRTKHRAVARLLALMEERVNRRPVHVNLMHGNVPDEAERLKEEILSRFNCVELYVTGFTPAIGAHFGPGVLSLAFYAEG